MKETTTIIVALPEVDDKVHKISSEKVPHLTMLYLGDAFNSLDVPDIVTFVQHAATHLDPFYLPVDYRGTLGDEEADVLFFEENSWSSPNLKTFRHQLLQNESIRRAYESTEQFADWTPHLTLGYPTSPAQEDDSDYPKIHGVHFDRLAVWFGDYEGPEIRLKNESDSLEVSMSDVSTTQRGASAVKELFHYGVKGMRWGITTKDGAPHVTQTREKKALRNTKDVTVTQRKAGTYVKAKGGQRQKAADDAVKAQAGRQKAKKSTTDALSNKELRDTIERMRLEQEFAKLNKKVSRKGQGFINKLLQSPEMKQTAADLAKKVAAKA